MKHPVEIVFDALTSIVVPAMEAPVSVDGFCSCCGRAHHEFGGKGFVGLNSYKQRYIHCIACHSFNVGSPEVTGIERGDSVPQKFGMWSGVGAVIDVKFGRSTLLAPDGVIKKLPKYFLDRVHVEDVKVSQHLNWIIGNQVELPFIYIRIWSKNIFAHSKSKCDRKLGFGLVL